MLTDDIRKIPIPLIDTPVKDIHHLASVELALQACQIAVLRELTAQVSEVVGQLAGIYEELQTIRNKVGD
jgi:hypothetical protein